jgi:transposase-like protein
MNAETTGPKTLQEAVLHYADLDLCHAYMAKLKWPDGAVKCPQCGCNQIGHIATRRMYQCKAKACHKQFSVKVGTIFEDSPLGLDKWFVAVWSITNAKNGIGSCELARAIGITQKSAWHMLHRIRHAMGGKSLTPFSGVVESDETYIGGKAKNMHFSRRREKILGTGGVGKDVVHGLIGRGDKKRGNKVKAKVVANVKEKTLLPIIEENVVSGSTIYTDSLQSYNTVASQYIHDSVNHAKTYVRGAVHTNEMEYFWSLLKGSIHGTYVAVDAPHLQRYVDEQAFRFNERKVNNSLRFNIVMPGIVGKRLS